MSNIYIVVVSFNGMKWIEKCLYSCKGFIVILVDNASSDNTIEFVKNNFPDVLILQQKNNLGFGKANNLGISYALQNGADYVFLLNQDVYIQPNTIENLLRVSLSHSDYGILSPIHLNGLGRDLDKNFSLYVSPNKNSIFFSDAILNKMTAVYDFSFINAAAWFIPRSVFLEVGAFDPMFFHYQEDNNFCQRILYHNYKIGVVPNSFILHDRENRGNLLTDKFSAKYYNNYCNQLKVKYANLNYDFNKDDIIFEKKRQVKLVVKSFLMFRFDDFIGYLKQFKLIRSVFEQIVASRVYNKKTSNMVHLMNIKK